MANTAMLRARGLHTFNSYLSAIPEGALLKADDVVIDKDGVIEPRRGITQYGTVGATIADAAKQLILYKDRILAHYSSSLSFDDGTGTFTDFSGTFSETETGLRIKSVESNSNLYITTADGIKKIAATSAATLGSASVGAAGPIKALTGTGQCDFTQPIFPGYSKVAYRVTWGTKDVNGNLIEGAPSPAIEITNQSPDSCAFQLTFLVPNAITTDYFYRVYRTQVATAASFSTLVDVETGDEMRLVVEDAYVSGSEVTLVDVTPDSFRDQSQNLYTNEFSGEGILQSNEPPPFAKDVALFKNAVFFSDTRLKHKLLFNLLGVGEFLSVGGVQDSVDITNISYSSPDTTITLTSTVGLSVNQKIVIVESGSATLDGVQTIASIAGNDIVVQADGTGASAANCSIYGASLTVAKGATTNSYYFVGRPEIADIAWPAKVSLVDGGYIILSSAENKNKYTLWVDKTGSTAAPTGLDTVGTIKIRVDVSSVGINTASEVADAVVAALDASSYDFISVNTLGTTRITCSNSGVADDAVDGLLAANVTITKIQNGHGEDLAKKYVRLSTFISAAQNIDDTARSLTKVITANPSEIVNAYYIFKPNDLPGQMLLESKDLDITGFTVSASVGASFSPNLSSAVASDNEAHGNRLYYSKVSQPEAVPIVNYLTVGPKDKRIKRIIALRDSLFILKEEGIYRLTGESSANYFVTLFDNSAAIVGPDTATVMNNQIYCLTTQGITTITETGVSVVSRPIENIITKITAPAFENFKTLCFGASYESDRAYFLWIPKNDYDTTAPQCLRYNTFTNTWTMWNKAANCAVVGTSANKLFIGSGTDNYIDVERKQLNRLDYADRQYNYTLGSNAFYPDYVEVSSTLQMDKGDVLRQIQYVTMAQVIRLAKKMFFDAGIPDTVGNNNKLFYSQYSLDHGCNLQNELSALITQLNSDTGATFNTTFSLDFATFQTEYNTLIADLNSSNLLAQKNYQTSTGTVPFEMLISGVTSNTKITVLSSQDFIQGEYTLYKSITSEVIWAPVTFGDPSMLKHVRESTVIFDNAGLAYASIGYNTDLSTNYEDIPFILEGDGSWGVFFYSSTTWGGEGSNRPFRTLIPRQKQRCRFIRARFKHSTAFYKYGLLGISYTFEINSERAYK